MNESTIRRLIEMVEESEIESLEVTRFFRKIKITKRLNGNSKNGNGEHTNTVYLEPNQQQPPTPVATERAEVRTPPPAPEEPKSTLVEITSPMVGTYYHAPAPDADPFVSVGTRVKPGETVCIVEAMKLMNEIEAEVTGVIREIKVENAQAVEYGQVLFLVDPNG